MQQCFLRGGGDVAVRLGAETCRPAEVDQGACWLGCTGLLQFVQQFRFVMGERPPGGTRKVLQSAQDAVEVLPWDGSCLLQLCDVLAPLCSSRWVLFPLANCIRVEASGCC